MTDACPAIPSASATAALTSNDELKPSGLAFTSASYRGLKLASDVRTGLAEVCPRPHRLAVFTVVPSRLRYSRSPGSPRPALILSSRSFSSTLPTRQGVQ